MLYSKRLTIIAIITYLLLIPLAAYFKYFPMVVNATITNVLIFFLVFILASLLVYGGFSLKESKDIYLILPQSLIFVFIARAIPNLRLSYPPLHDPYYHFVAALNVINFGTLRPILGWWYWGTNVQLHWPMMHLLTTALVNMTNVDVMQFFRYQEPALGMIYFLAVFMLAKTVTGNNGVAIVSALFASLSDVTIFYQSEYHPQGIAIIFFVLLIYVFIKSRNANNILFRYVALIFIGAFTLSHYFTPLFLALIFSAYMIMLIMIGIPPLNIFTKNKFHELTEDIKLDYTFALIVIIPSLIYQFLIYTVFTTDILGMAGRAVAQNAQLASITQSVSTTPSISMIQSEVPFITSTLSASKWALFVLAIVSIIWILKTKNVNEFRIFTFFISIVLAGITGYFILAVPVDRIITFYAPFSAIFASLTLYRFKNEWFKKIHINKKMILIILIAPTIITAGFFNSQTPAYFFKDSGMNTYYWYSNRLPSMDEYKIAGEWIGRYTLSDSRTYTEFDTKIIVFYFGNIAGKNVRKINPKNLVTNATIVTNPNLISNLLYIDGRSSYLKNYNRIYSNREVQIHT